MLLHPPLAQYTPDRATIGQIGTKSMEELLCRSCPARSRTTSEQARSVCCCATASPAPRSRCGRGPSTWPEHGVSVSLPRQPGHGTTWQEMNRTRWEDWYAEVDKAFEDLQGRCAEVFVAGLSLGGCLALRLAEVHGDGDQGRCGGQPVVVNDVPLLQAGAGAQVVRRRRCRGWRRRQEAGSDRAGLCAHPGEGGGRRCPRCGRWSRPTSAR